MEKLAGTLCALVLVAACGDDDGGLAGDAGREAATRDLGPGPASDASFTDARSDAMADGDTPAPPAPPPPPPDAGPSPSGSAAFRGRLLFAEPFDDADFASRGWYDGSRGAIATGENAPGGRGGALACRFVPGATGCEGGTPARRPLDEVDAVLLSFWVKHTADWVGSGRAYHPHLFQLVTNADDDYVGPASTHLTLLVEHVEGRALLALTDTLNVDADCVLLNDDSFVGCGGDFATYAFTEMRSVAACNGIVGDLDGRDCFDAGGGRWYSARVWRTPGVVFSTLPGPSFQGDWHHVEAYFELNTIESGVGIANGRIRYWLDGALLVSFDHVLMRTSAHASMRLDQLLLLPYIGDGSPIDQTIFIDEIAVHEGARP